MRDGYYLFCYLVVDELASDYKIYLRHDQNFSLWKKRGQHIELVHYWELERITRSKQHYLPIRTREQAKDLINYCLKDYCLTLDDLEEVLGTPNLDNVDSYSKLCIHKEYTLHAISHLYSTILTDTELFYNDNIIGFAVDAGSDNIVEWNHTQGKELVEYIGCIVRKGNIQLFEVKTPGLLWLGAVNKYHYREGTLMALASASESRINEEVLLLPDLNDPNDLDEVLEYVDKVDYLISSLNEKDENCRLNYFDKRFSFRDNVISMVMKVIQKKSIEIMDQNIQRIIETYEIDPTNYHLAIGGGYALNCPTNSFLLNKYKFKSFIAPPVVNDSGQSLGMALVYFWNNMEYFDFKLRNAFYGNEILVNDYNKEEYDGFIKSIEHYNSTQVVEDLIRGPIIWCMGRAEIGPRALGHRSILADPRCVDNKDQINRIKKRQWWRPVAPLIKSEDLSTWFYGDRPSPYMLCTYNIKRELAKEVPAILHLDYSARIQTVSKEDDIKLYELLEEFQNKTGIPILCNTSLNDAGEPIINSIDEALNFGLRKHIPILYFNDYRIELYHFEQYVEKEAKKANEFLKEIFQDVSQEEKMKRNPYQLEQGYIKYYYCRPNLCHLDIKKEKDVKFLKKIFMFEANQSPKLYELFELC